MLTAVHFAKAQSTTLEMNLQEVIVMAQQQAPSVQIAETRLTNNYWQYQSFLADFKPQIDLEADLPQLERGIQSYILPNGRDVFLSRASLTSSANIFLRQTLSLTGGTVYARTGLQHKYNFATEVDPSLNFFFSTPISVGFFQPLFAFNELKWGKKIEPLRYSESRRAYSEDMEQAAQTAASLFFDVLLAQFDVQAAEREKSNADTLYGINKGRFSVGRIAETELLQVELQVMNADSRLAAATVGLQSAMENLRNFLGIKQAVSFKLEPPTDIPVFGIDAAKALDFARQHRSETLQFERLLLEAERDVAEAKANNGVSLNINGSFGLSQTGNTLSEALSRPLDQERLSVGLRVPIADWGKAQSRLEIQKSNRELTNRIVEQDRINFEREVLLKVQQFELIRNQVKLALRAFEVAQKRNNITRQRYLIGKISITDLNLAIGEQEAARVSYVNALQAFWLTYYEIRLLTLYDFENDQPLVKVKEGF